MDCAHLCFCLHCASRRDSFQFVRKFNIKPERGEYWQVTLHVPFTSDANQTSENAKFN